MHKLRRGMKETKTVKESVQSKTSLREDIYDWAKDYILVEEHWNDKLELTADVIKEIKDAL